MGSVMGASALSSRSLHSEQADRKQSLLRVDRRLGDDSHSGMVKTAHKNNPRDRTFLTDHALDQTAFSLLRGSVMFFPFYSTAMLALESCDVIGLRLTKLMSGGRGARDEATLMVSEKINAMFEATASVVAGGTASSVVDRYREHVAANAKRLSR
jgi:hypothetical protein